MTVDRKASVDYCPFLQAGGVIIALGVYFYLGQYLDDAAAITAAVATLCAFWWSTEAVPIPVTSLLPFIVFPLTGVLDHGALAESYGNKYILLFMGGFMLSKAAEKSNAHLRISHAVIGVVGTSSNRRLVIGFMLAAAFCSMWISNTATALIMLPVALGVIRESRDDRPFSIGLLLAIAYGSSIGGMATLVGTPPNGVFAAAYEEATSQPVEFISWLKIGGPVALAMLLACGVVLAYPVRGKCHYVPMELGAWTKAQRRVLIILSLTALCWMTRRLPFGWGGWSEWWQTPLATDATVALLAVLALFLVPSGNSTQEGKREYLLDWKTASSIPWGILLLFAGGLAIAKAFTVSGLAADIGNGLEAVIVGQPHWVTISSLCLVVTMLTEVTSNTATTTMLMPVLAASASAAEMDPALLMIPATMSASCAFMLPVATPPNAIVFGGSRQITIPVMIRYGIVLNLIGVVVITLLCSMLVPT